MTNYAVIHTRDAALSGEFGRSYALRVFGLDESRLESLVGRYTRGPRKGMLAGRIEWEKVERGGWVKGGPGGGGVAVPGTYGHKITDRHGRVVWSKAHAEAEQRAAREAAERATPWGALRLRLTGPAVLRTRAQEEARRLLDARKDRAELAEGLENYRRILAHFRQLVAEGRREFDSLTLFCPSAVAFRLALRALPPE